MSSNAPIGIFDSGVGGLSVLAEIRRELPHEDLIYIADSAHAPYGSKSPDFIRSRSLELCRFLAEKGSKAIVVACNTATAVAITQLRHELELPIIGMEPAIKPAAAASASGRIGVLATEGTLASEKYDALISRFGNDIEIFSEPCHGLVEQVEKGELDSVATRELLQRYLQPLLRCDVDTIILGCTHYPFLKPLIADIAGSSDIALIDTGTAVARHLRETLGAHSLLRAGGRSGSELFYSSGTGNTSADTISSLWGAPVAPHHFPE